MLARTPLTTVILARRVARKLPKHRRDAIRDKVAAILKTCEPTAFAGEGPCRAGIRASLCMAGWRWADADFAAADIVLSALNLIGARRPTWQQGQPEWTQDGALPIERENCIRCRKPLPEGHRLFCSHICSSAHNGARRRLEKREEINAAWRAARAAWSAAQPERNCERCGAPYQPKRPRQKLCRPRCTGKP
ncbi:MAG: hypothetical protein ACOY5F_18865 [Pseudomonadota bacterium]